MELPKDIMSEIFFYLDPKDLYHYAATNKQAQKQTAVEWEKRVIEFNPKKSPSNVYDSLFWYREYLNIQKNTILSLLNTLLDTFRYINKKVYKRYARKDLYFCVLRLIEKTPSLIELKCVKQERRQLEDLLLQYMFQPLVNEFVERYFKLVYKNQNQCSDTRANHIFSYGISDLFVDPNEDTLP